MDNAQVELKVQEILDRAGSKGIQVDFPRLALERAALSTRLLELEAEMMKLGFNESPTSRKLVAEFLFDKEGLAETPRRSVANKYLKHYDHPFLPLYAEHQTKKRTLSLTKNIETFLVNGRLTTQWAGTNETSGRIYCSDFNVQQLPVPGRRALIADPGKKFLLIDYCQNELRVLAALSGDKALIEDLESGDPHANIYSRMHEIALDEVTSDQREEGKTFNFGLVYGMSARGLAQKLNCSETQAELKLDLFFSRYPVVAQFINQTRLLGEKQGWIENAFGHRRSKWDEDFEKRQRQYVNTLFQGTAASILKRAIIKVDEAGALEVVATVHDSILIQVDEIEDCTHIARWISSEFKGVSFPVDFAEGKSWGEAQENLHS